MYNSGTLSTFASWKYSSLAKCLPSMRKVVSSIPRPAEEDEEEGEKEGNKSFKNDEQGIIVHIQLGGGKSVTVSSCPAWAMKLSSRPVWVQRKTGHKINPNNQRSQGCGNHYYLCSILFHCLPDKLPAH